MSQVFNGSTGGGLTSVSSDATLTGDGTSGSPLSVVDPFTGVSTDATLTGDGKTTPLSVVATGGSVYSVAKTVFSNGGLPPISAPASVFPNAASWFTPTITSADVDFITGDIRFNNAGTYKITMQLSFDKIPDPSQHDVQINFGLTDAPPNPLLYENITYHHFESNGVGQFSAEFTTVLEATAGQTVQVAYVLGGTAGSTLNYFIGAEAGFIIVERVA